MSNLCMYCNKPVSSVARTPGEDGLHWSHARCTETEAENQRIMQSETDGFEGREAGDPIPSSSKSRLDFYTDQEVKHRNELAARLGVPVPGMSEWLREPLREARRVRYREAAITGLAMQYEIRGWNKTVSGYACCIADDAIDQEQEASDAMD